MERADEALPNDAFAFKILKILHPISMKYVYSRFACLLKRTSPFQKSPYTSYQNAVNLVQLGSKETLLGNEKLYLTT